MVDCSSSLDNKLNPWRPFKRDVFEVNIAVVLKELI